MVKKETISPLVNLIILMYLTLLGFVFVARLATFALLIPTPTALGASDSDVGKPHPHGATDPWETANVGALVRTGFAFTTIAVVHVFLVCYLVRGPSGASFKETHRNGGVWAFVASIAFWFMTTCFLFTYTSMARYGAHGMEWGFAAFISITILLVTEPSCARATAARMERATEASAQWRKSDMALLGSLSAALCTKKIEELTETDRNRDLEDEAGLGADADAEQVFQFRKTWIAQWSGAYGSFHDITIIDPMRFTYHSAPPCARPCDTLQVYSVKVAAITGDFQWPLDVFGMVAVRDSVDRNRNLVFYRARDNCQTLTRKDQCLELSGPSRAVVLEDPVIIEVDLKVKGTIESKEDLSLLAVPLAYSGGSGSCPFHQYTSKHSTLEFLLGEIVSSVEATICIRVIDGSWPDGFHAQFAARTTNVDHEKVILLEFGHDNVVPVSAHHGIMKLSRHVVSVDVSGTLKVSFRAWQDGCKSVVEGEAAFTPAEAGRSCGALHLGSCKMQVLVAWSLISSEPEPDYY